MSGDFLDYGGSSGSFWYFHFEQEALSDPQAAEENWFPKLPFAPVANMREVIAKHTAMSEEEKQERRDALMRKIDRGLGVVKTPKESHARAEMDAIMAKFRKASVKFDRDMRAIEAKEKKAWEKMKKKDWKL